MAPLKIAIVGAGPAGCTLARILTQSTVSSLLSIIIFEGEVDLSVRYQGGTLDLHQASGIDALRTAGLMTEFDKHARYNGHNVILSDKYLTKYMDFSDKEGDKSGRAPEIDRFRLRQLLLDALPKGMVQWGKRLHNVTNNQTDGGFTLCFKDGSTASGFDLVVGADGAWSKVRPVVSDEQPFFSGVGGYTFTIKEASKTVPETVKLVNGGNFFTIHDQVFLSQQQMGDDMLQVTAFWAVDGNDDKWAQKTTHDDMDLEAAKRFVLDKKLRDWDPSLRYAIEKAHNSHTYLRSNSLYMLPSGLTWEHRKGVTLLGDAAHVIPFGGEGVNQALADAKVLAQDIIEALSRGVDQESKDLSIALDSATVEFEKEMFSRMAVVTGMCHKLTYLTFFESGGLYKNIEKWLLAMFVNELPLRMLTLPLAVAITYTYYFFFRLWHRPRSDTSRQVV